MDLSTISHKVRLQYEKYPYPDFDPDWDKPQLLVSGHLSLMCELIWGGKKSPRHLRVLDAGCGTGSALVAMAMSYPETDIVAVDFSETSINKAENLAHQYNTKNIRFFTLPIEQIEELKLQFDFVSASGVLHHLANPAAGLKAIGNVLDPQGAVSIMVYGKYGRTGIYMLQNALKQIKKALDPVNEDQALPTDTIPFAHQLALNIPPWHPMKTRSKGREIQEGKDAGIVDLLLHANDIPFDVPAVYKMCEDADMKFHRWLFPIIYNVDNFFNDPYIQNQISKTVLPHPQQEEIAELAHGCNSKHSFIAVKKEFSPPLFPTANGQWRQLHARLTPCMAWNRTSPTPGKTDTFSVPFTIIQDAWGPLELSRWELLFLGQIFPEITLEEALNKPDVKNAIPFKENKDIDRAVEQLLKKAIDRLAILFLEKWNR